MKYTLKPHQHVKIWLSKKPDVFLTLENQFRLVEMRSKNPKDAIHLVYSRELLSETARKELDVFCKAHAITPVCIEDDVIHHCSSEEERQLIKLYQQEIHALGKGGNLAAASDILRWLSPVYSRGVYSDFDVKVITEGIPDTIEVKQAIILNVGSVRRGVEVDGKELESPCVNNDILAIIGDDAHALDQIKRVQRYISNAYANRRVYRNAFDNEDYLYPYYLKQLLGMKALRISKYIRNSTEGVINEHLFRGFDIDNANPIRLREEIARKMSAPPIEFCRYELEFHQKGCTQSLDDEQVVRKYLALFYSKEQVERCRNPFEVMEYTVEGRLHQFYTATVVYSTGPGAVQLGLFEHTMFPEDQIERKIQPFSLLQYGLEKAFHSSSKDFHMSPEAYDKFLRTGGSDHSWTPKGENKSGVRDEKMSQATLQLQSFFRGSQTRKKLEESKSKMPGLKTDPYG